MAERFSGCYTAIVTPFDEAGAVDYDALGGHIDAQLEGGVTGVVPCGTTGESPTLSHEEHREVIRFTVERVGGRAHVMGGCGSNATDEAISLTKYAKEVGADSTLQVCPYYNKPSQEGLYRHFRAIAEAAPLPVVLYNIPGRTGVALTPETIARLAAIENVLAVKEATGSMDQASHILELCDLDVLSGDDSLTLPLMAIGGRGVISVASNLVPSEIMGLVRAFQRGDVAQATERHRRLFPLCKALFIETNPVPVKEALGLMGRMSGRVRLPLSPLTDASRETLRAALARHGLL